MHAIQPTGRTMKALRSKSQPTSGADVAIGTRIRTYRRAAKVSQAQLGAALGVTFQQVQKYENGKNRVSAGKLGTIAERLKITPDKLLGTFARGNGPDPMEAIADRRVSEVLVLLSKLAPKRREGVVHALHAIVIALA
jgi:transcriptional regulator with XRE-family HTH domain